MKGAGCDPRPPAPPRGVGLTLCPPSPLDRAPGLALAGYDTQWRDHRRFGLQVLKNFGLGKKSMEERILQETQQVVRLLEESNGTNTTQHIYQVR